MTRSRESLEPLVVPKELDPWLVAEDPLDVPQVLCILLLVLLDHRFGWPCSHDVDGGSSRCLAIISPGELHISILAARSDFGTGWKSNISWRDAAFEDFLGF